MSTPHPAPKMKHTDFRMSLGGKCWNSISFNDTPNGSYHDGFVTTPNGIVGVYAQGGKDSFKHTEIRFSVAGLLFTRSWQKRHSPRGIVAKARKFAAECAKKASKEVRHA